MPRFDVYHSLLSSYDYAPVLGFILAILLLGCGDEELPGCSSDRDCRKGRFCQSNGECTLPGKIKECVDSTGALCSVSQSVKLKVSRNPVSFTMSNGSYYLSQPPYTSQSWEKIPAYIYQYSSSGKELAKFTPYKGSTDANVSFYGVQHISYKANGVFFVAVTSGIYVMNHSGEITDKIYYNPYSWPNGIEWNGRNLWIINGKCEISKLTENGAKVGSLLLREIFPKINKYFTDCNLITAFSIRENANIYFANDKYLFHLDISTNVLRIVKYSGRELIDLNATTNDLFGLHEFSSTISSLVIPQ